MPGETKDYAGSGGTCAILAAGIVPCLLVDHGPRGKEKRMTLFEKAQILGALERNLVHESARGFVDMSNPPVAYRAAKLTKTKIHKRKQVVRSGRALVWTPMKWKDIMKLEEGDVVSFLSSGKRQIGHVVSIREKKTFVGVTIAYNSVCIASVTEVKLVFGSVPTLLSPNTYYRGYVCKRVDF